MRWAFSAFVAFGLYGIWAVLIALSRRQSIGPFSAMLAHSCGSIVFAVSIFAILALRGKTEEHGRYGIALAAGAGAVVIIANLFLMISMSGDGRGNESKILILTALYPLIPLSVFRFFYREAITPAQWVGVLFAGVAIVLITHK
jgi:drug/metabolite transporter (DMT)-like permease